MCTCDVGLCHRGALGKGTLHTYPWGGVPTENIKERQDHDENLMQSAVKYPEWYSCKSINDVEDILCYTIPDDNPANWKIALPEDLITPTFKWYHQVTGHPGSKRLHGQ
jgi:hypothetical protein